MEGNAGVNVILGAEGGYLVVVFDKEQSPKTRSSNQALTSNLVGMQ
jgi:hypothetical protein